MSAESLEVPRAGTAATSGEGVAAPPGSAGTTVPSSVPEPAAAPEVVLDVRELKTYFFTYQGVVKALDGVSFQLRRGETTGLVGETGCGKSVTAFSITRLIPDPPGRIVGGHVRLRGADLLTGIDQEAKYRPIKGSNRVRVTRWYRRIVRANERMEAVRGRHISMIFQEPSQALNPVFSISNQVGELLFLHHGPRIVSEMLGATPAAPEVGPAIDALLAATEGGLPGPIREAADALGRAAKSTRLATEAFYITRGPGSPTAKRARLLEACRELHLTGLRRSHLRHRGRLLDLREQLNEARLSELRGTPLPAAKLRRLHWKERGERLRHFYAGLWGIRRWINRPLDRELLWRVVRVLEGVRIANPVRVAQGFPHELSGGMIQRVMIAMALSAEPEVLLADEPTTALDVTIQAQILDLLATLRHEFGTAILLITHDLAVIAEVADRVCVMYAGQIVEEGPVRAVFQHPLHPYTQGLLASVPRVDQPGKQLASIPGSVPNLLEPPSGCRFHPRCPFAMPVCRTARPPVTQEGPAHTVACYLYHGPTVQP